MKIDARLQFPPDFNKAVLSAMQAHLKQAGDSMTVTAATNRDGDPVAPHYVQVAVNVVVPNDWQVITRRRNLDGDVLVVRVK